MNLVMQEGSAPGRGAYGSTARASAMVDLTARIHANSRRVLYAITIPEYLEVWLQMLALNGILGT